MAGRRARGRDPGDGSVHGLESACRRARLHVDAWLGRHEDRGSYELVTVPTSRVMALCVPGSRPQVVVSDGLVELLDAAELDAVIGHEMAHHQLRHHRFLELAVVVEHAFLFVPGARRSARVLRDEVERSADEKAAERSQGPLPVSAALHTIALCGAVPDEPEVVASVAGRLRSLSRYGSFEIRSARMLTYAPMAALGIVAFAVATGWVTDAHHLLALGGHCYS
ncbi:MAG: M56 family metallopeptidase [Acidimicrobiia bacterium]|nr:M56 family metallopeptidase [Acidimicrobiia bacterium]